MAFGYPVLLELTGRPAVVIGEFAVEAGKVDGLLVAGAEVTVIARGPAATLDRLDRDPRVVVHRRGYRGPADLDGAVLCVAHAPEPGVRTAIAADARAAGVLVNVMDDVPNCDFAAPAIVRRGDLVIAIGTGGRAPALASRLRADLAERFGPVWTELVDVVGRVRTATLPHLPDFEDRSRRWRSALDLDELEELVGTGQGDLAATRLRNRLLEGLTGALPEGLVEGEVEGLTGGVDGGTHPSPAMGYAPPPGDPAPEGRGEARRGRGPGPGAERAPRSGLEAPRSGLEAPGSGLEGAA